MGLLGDIVESVQAGLSRAWNVTEWLSPAGSDLRHVIDAVENALESSIVQGLNENTRRETEAFKAAFRFSQRAVEDPRALLQEAIEGWHIQLQRALALLNIDKAGDVEGPAVSPLEQIQVETKLGTDAAQERVTAAVTTINLILMTATVISIATEAASAGKVRSIAEGIQSWIWANGLGSLSPLAFTPQINASVAPYLTRLYNQRSQAQIPPVTDIIRFQLREAYLPGRREELVGTEERPVFDELMEQWGFNKFHADTYWAAHWQLPSIGQLNDMLFRGIIDEDTWEDFVRFNDLEPTSIPRLKSIIYNTFTRVDARRMSLLGVLDDDELLQAYADQGYFAETEVRSDGKRRAVSKGNPDFTVDKAEALVVFTKVFNALPELRRRFAKGWITPAQVLDEIQATGIPALRGQRIFETIVKADQGERTAPERELSRALIARAWKLREVSYPQAVFLLERIGWGGAEAELILRVKDLPIDIEDFQATQLGTRLIGAVVGPVARSGLDPDE